MVPTLLDLPRDALERTFVHVAYDKKLHGVVGLHKITGLEMCCKELRQLSITSSKVWRRVAAVLPFKLVKHGDGEYAVPRHVEGFVAWLQRRRHAILDLKLVLPGGNPTELASQLVTQGLAGGALQQLTIVTNVLGLASPLVQPLTLSAGWLGCLFHLERLSVTCDELTFSPSFEQLDGLRSLALHAGFEYFVPRHLPPQLRELALCSVDARAIPWCISSLHSLERLAVECTGEQCAPNDYDYYSDDETTWPHEGPLALEGIGALTALTLLKLGKGTVSGSLPRELGAATGLCTLRLERLELAGTMVQLQELSALSELTLAGCTFDGDVSLPTEVLTDGRLKVLGLGSEALCWTWMEAELALQPLPPLGSSIQRLTVHARAAAAHPYRLPRSLTELRLAGNYEDESSRRQDASELLALMATVASLPRLRVLHGLAEHVRHAQFATAQEAQRAQAALAKLLRLRPHLAPG